MKLKPLLRYPGASTKISGKHMYTPLFTSNQAIIYIKPSHYLHQTKPLFTSNHAIIYIKPSHYLHQTKPLFTSNRAIIYIKPSHYLHPILPRDTSAFLAPSQSVPPVAELHSHRRFPVENDPPHVGILFDLSHNNLAIFDAMQRRHVTQATIRVTRSN